MGSDRPSATGPSPAAARVERVLRTIGEGSAAFVAIPERRYVPMWRAPRESARGFALDAKAPRGRGTAPMLVADARMDRRGTDWYEVYLPLRPNGSTAWVRGEDVRLRVRHERIEVDLSRRMLWRYVDGELVDRLRVGVGTPASPTAVGTFYVWVKVPFRPPHPAYGVFALGLSGFSPVLSDWPGEGRMAIHGTADPADRGRAVSHGCVRVWNPEMQRLVDVPLGTPVIIRP